MEISKAGIYEKHGQTILGSVDLVYGKVSDELEAAFGTDYDDYAASRLQFQKQTDAANNDVEAYLMGLAAKRL